jgi:prepilin-type processing-associated H-X9-DG protein
MLQEQAVAAQTSQFYSTYYTDYRDKVVPGAPHWSWTHWSPGGTNADINMTVSDPYDRSNRVYGSAIKVWTLILWAYAGNADTFWLRDINLYNEFRVRPPVNSGQYTTPGTTYTYYQSGSYPAALAFHPRFGMNTVYVGGDYSQGAFRRGGRPGPNPQSSGGDFYVTDVAQVRFTSDLLVFASSRGGDVQDGSWWGFAANYPDSGRIRSGYFGVKPPRPHPVGRSAGIGAPFTLGGGWTSPATDNTWNRSRAPSYFGNLEARFFNKVTATFFDGHVEMKTIEQMRNMRMWSNFATRPDWAFTPNRF